MQGVDAEGAKSVGDLVSASNAFMQRPVAQRSQHTGYFAARVARRLADGKPEILLVATTRHLCWRFTQTKVACVDGGWKYNVMSYPLHLLGGLNPAGQLCVMGLGITSGLQKELVHKMLQSYAHEVESATGQQPDNDFSYQMEKPHTEPQQALCSTPKA